MTLLTSRFHNQRRESFCCYSFHSASAMLNSGPKCASHYRLYMYNYIIGSNLSPIEKTPFRTFSELSLPIFSSSEDAALRGFLTSLFFRPLFKSHLSRDCLLTVSESFQMREVAQPTILLCVPRSSRSLSPAAAEGGREPLARCNSDRESEFVTFPYCVRLVALKSLFIRMRFFKPLWPISRRILRIFFVDLCCHSEVILLSSLFLLLLSSLC